MELSKMSDAITIIISNEIEGRKFETSRSLLSKYSEYFENIFSECKDLENENKLVIENQDPQLFEHILKYFANITYKIPEEYTEKSKFYLLKDRSDEAFELYNTYNLKMNEIITNFKNCNQNLIDSKQILRNELINKIKTTYTYIYIVDDNFGYCRFVRKTVFIGNGNTRIFLNADDAEKYRSNRIKRDPKHYEYDEDDSTKRKITLKKVSPLKKETLNTLSSYPLDKLALLFGIKIENFTYKFKKIEE